MLDIKFVVFNNRYNESELSKITDPKKFVSIASKNKALSVVQDIKSGFILSADTIGFFENNILLKPSSNLDAINTLKSLKNKSHIVFTGITLIKIDNNEQHIYTAVEKSRVTFGNYPDELILKYVLSGKANDKAASYGIQDEGAFFVKKISGCFYNVMGLPVNKLLKLLIKAKYPL